MAEMTWYISIGSMMSGTAVRIRGIYPTHSLACEIQNHRRIFSRLSGMASLVPEEGSIVHGVAHRMTTDELRPACEKYGYRERD